jgi:hypothetical protein
MKIKIPTRMIKAILLLTATWAVLITGLTVTSATQAYFSSNSGYLPVVFNQQPSLTPTQTATSRPTPTATAAPISEENKNCAYYDNVEICASVSDGNPSQYTRVNVYARIRILGAGQPNLPMTATWQYKTVTRTCSGTTNWQGIAACDRYISGATAGYTVYIDVDIQGYQVQTWFTPH